MKLRYVTVVSLFGLSMLIPGVSATHDPNDFFVLETVDTGTIWHSIHGTATTQWAVGESGGVARVWKRSGGTWANEAGFPDGFLGAARDVYAISDSDVWVVGGIIASTETSIGNNLAHWDGASWTLSSVTPPGLSQPNTINEVHSIWALGTNDVWIIGATFQQPTGVAAARIDKWNGASWVRQDTPISISLFQAGTVREGRIWLSDSTHGWASVCANREALDNCQAGSGSQLWPGQTDPWVGENPQCTGTPTAGFRAFWGTSSTNVYIAGWATGVLMPPAPPMPKPLLARCTGAGWVTQSAPTNEKLRDIYGSGSTDVWAVGDGGVILHNTGTDWTTEPMVTTNNLRSVFAPTSALAWIVDDQGGIWKLQVNANTALPTLTGLQWDPNEVFVTASQAQCLGDETSFSISLEPGLGAGGMNAYIINSDSNIVVETFTSAGLFNLNNKYLHTSRPYPAGDYQFLITADVIGLLSADNFAGTAFNVPVGSCFTAADALAIQNRFNAVDNTLANLSITQNFYDNSTTFLNQTFAGGNNSITFEENTYLNQTFNGGTQNFTYNFNGTNYVNTTLNNANGTFTFNNFTVEDMTGDFVQAIDLTAPLILLTLLIVWAEKTKEYAIYAVAVLAGVIATIYLWDGVAFLRTLIFGVTILVALRGWNQWDTDMKKEQEKE